MTTRLLARPVGAALFLLSALLGALPGRAQSVVLEQWALTSNTSATTVAPGTVATTPTLTSGALTPLPTNNLTTANGTTVPAIQPYSGLGQALAPAADGGSWNNNTASPPTRYEEFTYTVAAGYATRLDSLVLSAALSGGSNGRIGVAYSIDNFTTTNYLSGSLSSGLVSNGTSLNATNNVTAATDAYTILRLPLVSGGATTGLKLTAGSTVAFRVYYGVATSGSGRYGLLRGFSVKGQAITVGGVAATSAQVSFNTRAAGGYTYALTTTPTGGTATLTTAPSAGNNYVATYTISGLTASTAYTVTAAATGTPGNTTITSASFTTASPSTCGNVGSLAAGNLTPASAQISFAAGSNNTSYVVTYTPSGGSTTTVSPNPTTSPVNLPGLTAATSYTVTVQGLCASGGPSTAQQVTFATPACADPTGLGTSNITSTTADVSFAQPASGNTNTGYTLKYYPTVAGTPVTTQNLGAAATGSSLTGLTSSTSYTVTLQSVCSGGSGTLLTTQFTTAAPPTCADPTGLAVTSRTSTSATLGFTPGSGNSSYTVTYYPTGSPGLAQTVTPTPTASPVVIGGLTPATAYTATLQSSCSNGASGTVQSITFTTRLASSPVLQQWPLTANGSDDATVRSPGVLASMPTLTGLALSNNTANDGESAGLLPPYSAAFGQGVAPNADGTGWTNTTPSATRYEEFTVTASAGGSVRIDSLGLMAGGYGGSAGLALAYSTSNFTTTPTYLVGSASSSATLPKVSSSGFTMLRLPLAGTTGVTLSAGSTLTVRLYYSLGNNPRHALTRNLYVTGVATPTCPAATAVNISNVTPTSAQLNFTPGSGNTGYTVTLTPQGGSTTTVTPAPTASPVALTGLDASTTYTVTLQTSCGGTPGYVQSLSFTTPAANSAVLQRWPLTADNTDNAAVRSYAVTASTPAFTGLVSSTNTTAGSPPIPAYSATYGQAFAPAGNGGGWSGSVSSGTLGGTLYEDFTLTASSGNSLRADTLVFSAAYYNTSAGYVAAAYSTDNFATSPTFVLGTLAAPVAASNYSSAIPPFTTYRVALGGLTRASGQSLKVRLYFGANTGNPGRYALLRNVYFAGEGFVNNLPNLTISDTRSVNSGTTYGNVTIMPGGAATLTGPLTAQGAVTVQNGGVLSTNCQPLTGPATFALNAGAELRICDPAGITATAATGAVQTTGQRTYSPDALYTYTGTTTAGANPATGDGLPATVRLLTMSLQAATDTLQLGSNLTVTSGLAATRGILKAYAPTGTPSYVVTMNSGTTTISETSSSFVLGQVRSATLFFGSDGSNSTFGGLGVRLVAHTATNLPGNTYVLRSTGQPVYGQGTSTSIRRQYRVVPTTDTGLNVDATFTYNPTTAELNGIPAANLQLFSRPIAGGNWMPETATINTTTASATALTHLSDWTLGNLANPLPVELVKFEATRQNSAVLLTWTTASELSNRGFEVQAAADGKDYQVLGFVAGAGSSASARSYQYLDASARPGLHYYRLRQLDLDGTATYSPVRTVQVAGPAGTTLQATPNPFGGDALTLFTQATAATQATLRLTDALGRVVRTQLLEVPAGAAQLSVAGLAGLPAGLYVAELVLDGQPQRVKLVRE